MSSVVRRAALAALTLALVAGCGKKTNDEKVVASAGDVKVTLADFNAAYNRITATNRPDITTLEGKRAFANDLLNKEILIAEANRMGGITDPKILEQLDFTNRNKVATILYREEIESKVELLGKDVEELYEKRKVALKASHILLRDMETAQKLREEIASGKISFEEAAKQFSIDQSTRQAGGALGLVQWGRTVPTFQQKAFELEPGVLSEPVETEFGVHLIRVAERVPQDIGTREQASHRLREDARRQKELLRMKEYVAELEKKSNLQFDDAGLDLIGQLTLDLAKVDIDSVPAELHYVPSATEEQKQTPVATFLGRTWTVGDYISWIAKQPPTGRPVTPMPKQGLRELIRTTQIQNELVTAEAIAMGLDKRPEAMDEARRIREQILIEMVHSRFLQEADVPEERVRSVYDSTSQASPDAWKLPERVNMKVLVSVTEGPVREGLKRIRAGQPEDEVIKALSEDSRTKFKGGETGLIARGNYALKLEDVAFSRAPGSGWSDPVVTDTGVGSVKVLAHEQPRVATFDEVKVELTKRLADQSGERAFEDWLTQQRETRKAQVFDNVLGLIGQAVTGGTPPPQMPAAPGSAPAGEHSAGDGHNHSHEGEAPQATPPAEGTDATGTGK